MEDFKTMDLRITVGELVAERPSRSRVFEKIGIDYCCGGKITLQEACSRQGLDPEAVAQALSAADSSPEATNYATMSLTELADHIVATHHAYLKLELPRLAQLVDKVVDVHGSKDARLAELQGVYAAFQDEITLHLMKEERILFPMIRSMDDLGASAASHCGGIGNPIRVMEHEHQSAGDALARMRKLTDGYVAPESACNTWRALCSGLAELERDTHDHIHKENNILFPRALEE
jgi:regulator of cell morphogenesis and NO signaling